MIRVDIHSIGLDPSTQQPVIVLSEDEGVRLLPIWIGHPEAAAILIAVEEVDMPRPMTHDLLLNSIAAAGFVLERVEVTRVEEGTFYAALVLRGEERTIAVDARPSDSMALAVRAGCAIYVDEAVLETAGVIPDDDEEEVVERFRDFLDHVDPEDFVH